MTEFLFSPRNVMQDVIACRVQYLSRRVSLAGYEQIPRLKIH